MDDQEYINSLPVGRHGLPDLRYCTHKDGKEESWWEHDARGIPLCKVCRLCKKVKLSGYRPEILTGYNQNDVDERIEPEDY